MPDPTGYLTPAHCDMCTEILRRGALNAQVIEACKRCGLPVDEQEAQQASLLKTFAAIKREFFPHNS